MGFSIDLLNTIRAEASEEYMERIPVATRRNIGSLGEALTEYPLLRNEYQEALVNKIGKTILESKLFKNKLGRFKKGKATPHDVEEIFIEMATTIRLKGDNDGMDFASLSLGLDSGKGIRTELNNINHGEELMHGGMALGNFGQPEVKSIYHRQSRQDIYPVTIGDLDFKRVFRSESTHDEFVTGLINSLYSGAEYDEWIIMKQMIGSYSGYDTYNVEKFAMEIGPAGYVSNMERFLATVKKASLDISFPSRDHNAMGVMTWTKPEDQVLMIHKDVLVETDVTTLAKTFHLNKMDIPVDNIVIMDDFGEATNIYAILVDKDIFRIWDTLFHFEAQRNALGLYTNYFLHVHQIMSMSKFKNAIAFRVPVE